MTKDELNTLEARFAKHVAETAQRQTVWIAGLIFAAVGAAAAIVHFAK